MSAAGLRALRERRGTVLPTLAVTIAALVGLTVGAAAGVGPLHAVYELTVAGSDDDAGGLQQEVADAAAFRTALLPAVIGRTLADHAVTVVTLPGAASTTELMAALRAAGADVSGPLSLTADYLDPGRVRVLRDLTAQVAPAPAKAARDALPSGASPQTQLDTVLAHSLVTRDAAALGRADTGRATLLDALAKVGALDAPASELRGADLVVLVVPEGGTAGAADRGAGLATALAKAGRAVVVLTEAERGAASTGTVGALRSLTGNAAGATSASTVDAAGTQGAITTVLALRSRLAGQAAGHYGQAADAAALVPATPTGTSSRP